MENKIGKLFIVTGPSGVGKGTILAEFLKNNKNARYSVSTTTRKPREGEVHGVHYNFVSEAEFLNSTAANEFLEHAKYGENYYATSKNFVQEMLNAGRDVILEIEVQGAVQVMEKCPDAVSIFITAPSLEELENRLRGRKTEDEASILRRLEIARTEIAQIEKFKHNVKNDTVQSALLQLQKIYDREVL